MRDPAKATELQIRKQINKTVNASREMVKSIAQHLLPQEYVETIEQAMANDVEVSLSVTLHPLPSVSLLAGGHLICTLAGTRARPTKLH